MTESIIVYRSRSEQAMDQMLYDSGAGAWIVPIVGALIVGGIAYAIGHRIARSVLTYRSHQELAGQIAAVVVGVITFLKLAAPLWG